MVMPLDGIRVVEWGAYQQGPMVGAMLADLGADVVKIEELGKGDPSRGFARIGGLSLAFSYMPHCYFEMINRNKRSFAVDLKKPQAREVIYRLIEHSDVFVHNIRLEAGERLGLDYETLRRRNPKLIYASATGFGSQGPDRERASYDPVGLSRSGFVDLFSPPGSGEPRYPPIGISDQMGAIMLSYGVLAALRARDQTGLGQQVESSLLSSMMWLQYLYVHTFLMTGQRMCWTPHFEATNPMSNFYRCRDGKWLFLSMIQPERFWPDFCTALGRADLEHDPRYNTMEKRVENHRALIVEVDAVFAGRTSDEWIAVFRRYPDFAFQTVNSVADLPEDPQVKANNYIVDVPHLPNGTVPMVNVPIKLSETPGSIRLPAPEVGQHTEEVLTEICGYTWDDIIALREAGVV